MINWDTIAKHLHQKNVSPDVLLSMHIFIDAIDPPKELVRVIISFQKTLPHLQKLTAIYPEYGSILHTNAWSTICQEITNSEELRLLLDDSSKKRGKMPLRGVYDTNPSYVTLWNRPDIEPYQGAYLKLLSHCLFIKAAFCIRVDQQAAHGIQPDNFSGNISAALLAVRNLAENDRRIKLTQLPDLDEPFDKILSKLDSNDPDLAALRVMYRYFIGIRKPPRRNPDDNNTDQVRKSSEARFSQPAEIITSTHNGDPGQSGTVNDSVLIQLPMSTEKAAYEAEYVGCNPHEAKSGIEIIAPKISSGFQRQPRSGLQKVQGKRVRKAGLALANQRLTFRWEELSLHEVSSFLSAVADVLISKESSLYVKKRAVPLELAALASLLFWYGQRVSTVHDIRFFEHNRVSETDGPGIVVKDGKMLHWQVKPALPERKRLPDDKQQEHACPTITSLRLKSGIGVELVVSEYLKTRKFKHGDCIFGKGIDYYSPLFDSFISLINQRHATRLTANRISDHIFNTIEHHSDLTVAMFVIGRDAFLGRNQSFYTAVSVPWLQKLFMEVCQSVRDRHFKEQPRESQRRIGNTAGLTHTLEYSKYVGSPFRPTTQTVRHLVCHLQNLLKKAAASEKSVLKLMRLHNSVTRYTAFMVAFATGFRAIRDPFLTAAEIDWHSGFAVLRDKDNEDGYNARLIWIPPICLQQLRLFQEHQHNVLTRFNLLIPGLQHQSERLSNLVTGRFMFLTRQDNDTEEYIALPFGPKVSANALRQVYSLPFNASRHYLRSTLLERGCPVEIINAFMGHFERGEEPWGRFSGLSPLTYRNQLASFLVPLLHEDGWQALPGLGAKL